MQKVNNRGSVTHSYTQYIGGNMRIVEAGGEAKKMGQTQS